MEMIALTSENRSILGPLEGLLAADNVEAYLVGGFVRDALLGRETKDIDLAVKADAHMLARKLERPALASSSRAGLTGCSLSPPCPTAPSPSTSSAASPSAASPVWPNSDSSWAPHRSEFFS